MFRNLLQIKGISTATATKMCFLLGVSSNTIYSKLSTHKIDQLNLLLSIYKKKTSPFYFNALIHDVNSLFALSRGPNTPVTPKDPASPWPPVTGDAPLGGAGGNSPVTPHFSEAENTPPPFTGGAPLGGAEGYGGNSPYAPPLGGVLLIPRRGIFSFAEKEERGIGEIGVFSAIGIKGGETPLGGAPHLVEEHLGNRSEKVLGAVNMSPRVPKGQRILHSPILTSLDDFKKENLKILITLNTYRGRRFKYGYPVKGQRTRSNGRTARRLNRIKL